MKDKTQKFDNIIQKELLNGCSSQDISLCNGRMGLILFFSHCFRDTGIQMYDDIAEELFNDISEDIHTKLPIDFRDGLCGIGWGIEYLIQNGFAEGSNEILEEIDLKIMEKDVRRIKDFSFETGLEGIAWYVLLRLKSPYPSENFDATYEHDILHTCERNRAQISETLTTYLENRQTLPYPYPYIFNRVLNEEEDTLSWKTGLKQFVL